MTFTVPVIDWIALLPIVIVLGAGALGVLLEALIRNTALRRKVQLGLTGSALLAALIAVATEHDDPLCREAAVAALGALGDDAGLPTIIAALDDKPAVRRRAVIALAPYEGPEVDAALERASQDRDRQVRQAAEDLSRSEREPFRPN